MVCKLLMAASVVQVVWKDLPHTRNCHQSSACGCPGPGPAAKSAVQLLTMLAHAVQVSNLYVADASLFPTSTGVNPMITVEAMAYMVAQGLAQTFKDGAVPQSQKAVFAPEE